MRPLLLPGTHVLRRGEGLLQVGLDPQSALVLPDRPEVRGALDRLASSAAAAAGDRPTLAVLEREGLVVDEHALLPLLAPDRAEDHSATAALVRGCGDRTPQVLGERTDARVEVAGFGHPSGETLRHRLADLLGDAGLTPCSTAARARPATVAVLAGVGEPDRERVDAWTRAGTPYLVLRMTEGRARLGPFVVPGRTACLRCIDAHHTDADTAWPLLVRQYAAASAHDRADGAPEPLDPLLAALAVAWAARDLASFVDGRRPSTWSATLTLDADLRGLETQAWRRHPECGCEGLPASIWVHPSQWRS